MAYALGVPEEVYVTSPTYTLINEYPLENFTFYHVDLYRLSTEDEIWETGFFDIVNYDNIIAVEWWDMFEDTIPKSVIHITIEESDVLTRKISVFTNETSRFSDFKQYTP